MLGKLNDIEIEEVLRNNLLGRIGCHDDGKTYIVPVNYVYDGHSIIAHSVKGMKIEMMQKNPHICFEIDEVKNFTNWKSVIVWGEYHEITDSMERYRAMKFFVEHTLHTKISETAVPPELPGKKVHPWNSPSVKPVIYRIVILEKTGRYENESL